MARRARYAENMSARELAWQLLWALVRELPAAGTWTARERELWLQAVKAAVDLAIEVIPDLVVPPLDAPAAVSEASDD